MLYTWQFSVSFQSLILNVGVFLCTNMRECRRDFIRKLYKAPCRLELIFFNKRHLCFARIAYQNTSLVFQVDHHILRNSFVSIKQSYNNFLLAFSGFLTCMQLLGLLDWNRITYRSPLQNVCACVSFSSQGTCWFALPSERHSNLKRASSWIEINIFYSLMTKESKPSRRFEKEGLQVTRVYTQI